jgi:predicted ribosomally synthesized peptide with SipW-like signal peptide
MTDSGLSRRELLAGLGGIGVAGAASGAGTYALFSDRDDFDGVTRASGLALAIECEDAGACTSTDDGVSFGFDGLDRGDERNVSFVMTVQQNPARVWLATDCPEGAPLEDALEVELRGTDGTEVVGRLSDVRRRLHAGIRVDGANGCTAVGSPVRFELQAVLPEDVDTSVAGSEASLTLTFFAEQCRHADDGGDRNPFRTRSPCRKPASDPDHGRGDGAEGKSDEENGAGRENSDGDDTDGATQSDDATTDEPASTADATEGAEPDLETATPDADDEDANGEDPDDEDEGPDAADEDPDAESSDRGNASADPDDAGATPVADSDGESTDEDTTSGATQ